MAYLFERVVIAGVGLIGGSLALAGKRAGLFHTVVGLGRNMSTLEEAVRLGIADEITTDSQTAVTGADLFFAATPVESIIPLCLQVAPFMKEGCVITDGGSVKGEITRQLEKRLPPHVRFVGGHPIAGTEKSGPAAAFAELYEQRYTILTPTESTDKQALDMVTRMWEGVGAIVVEMTPEDHDAALAVISHLPHLVAYSLVETLDEMDDLGVIRKFIAGGFRDTTRIAASHPRMWRDIFSMNRGKVLESIEMFERHCAEFKRMIRDKDFDRLENRLDNVKKLREGME